MNGDKKNSPPPFVVKSCRPNTAISRQWAAPSCATEQIRSGVFKHIGGTEANRAEQIHNVLDQDWANDAEHSVEQLSMFQERCYYLSDCAKTNHNSYCCRYLYTNRLCRSLRLYKFIQSIYVALFWISTLISTPMSAPRHEISLLINKRCVCAISITKGIRRSRERLVYLPCNLSDSMSACFVKYPFLHQFFLSCLFNIAVHSPFCHSSLCIVSFYVIPRYSQASQRLPDGFLSVLLKRN